MPTLELAITMKQDGVMLPNFPLVRRLQAVEAENLNYLQQPSAAFVTVPGLPLSSGQIISALLLTADQAIAVQLNNQTGTDAGILLNAGGLLILIDANFAATPLARVQNNSGIAANVKGMAFGT